MLSGENVASMILFGQDTSVTYSVYSVSLGTGTSSLLGNGTVGTLLDITNFNTTANTAYMMIRVNVSNTTTQTIYGGRMFKDDAGTAITQSAIVPRDFMVNDD